MIKEYKLTERFLKKTLKRFFDMGKNDCWDITFNEECDKLFYLLIKEKEKEKFLKKCKRCLDDK